MAKNGEQTKQQEQNLGMENKNNDDQQDLPSWGLKAKKMKGGTHEGEVRKRKGGGLARKKCKNRNLGFTKLSQVFHKSLKQLLYMKCHCISLGYSPMRPEVTLNLTA